MLEAHEGEAYAARLRLAGVRVTAVRFAGIIHDFVMLNPLANTAAARGALILATAWLRAGFAAPPEQTIGPMTTRSNDNASSNDESGLSGAAR